MNLYVLLLFLHVLGAVGIFGAWAIDIVATGQILRALTGNQLRAAVTLHRDSAPIGFGSMIAAIVTGVWMMILQWGPVPWIVAAIADLVFIVIVGVTFERRTIPPLRAALLADGSRFPPGASRVGSALAASLLIRITSGVAILVLMTVKPGAPGATVIVAAAVALGVGAAIHAGRRSRSIATPH